jgi:hypothetical protein
MKRYERCAMALAMVAAALGGGAAIQWLAGGSGVNAAGPAARPDAAQSVRVRELVLIDDAGKQRAVLGVSADGPQLAFQDSDGKNRIILGQKPRAADQWAQDKSQWCLSLIDAKGNDRVLAHVYHEGGGSGLKVGDQNGKVRYSVGYVNDGNGGVSMFDTEGRLRFGIGMPPDKGYSINFRDEDNKVIWSAP